MEMQQMMEMMLKEIKAGREENRINQEKAEADRKADQEKAEADRKTDKEDLMAKLDADRKAAQEDLMAKLEADRAQTQEFMKMLEAYQAKTDAVLPAMQVTETSHKETAAHLCSDVLRTYTRENHTKKNGHTANAGTPVDQN
jgi:hypothetical protein